MHHRKYSTFLIISFALVSLMGGYSYFSNDLKSEAATSSGLSSSLDGKTSTSRTSTTINKKTAEDTAFLKKLASLSKIDIDTSIFESQNFRLLVDNNIKLEKVAYGRANPFSPTDRIVTDNKPAYVLITSAATAITATSAVLNGSIEGTTSNNIYFEYGTTETLGKTTAKVIPSLVGGLGANISALTPKTKYFYRVAANINGIINFGEIMSFSTN